MDTHDKLGRQYHTEGRYMTGAQRERIANAIANTRYFITRVPRETVKTALKDSNIRDFELHLRVSSPLKAENAEAALDQVGQYLDPEDPGNQQKVYMENISVDSVSRSSHPYVLLWNELRKRGFDISTEVYKSPPDQPEESQQSYYRLSAPSRLRPVIEKIVETSQFKTVAAAHEGPILTFGDFVKAFHATSLPVYDNSIQESEFHDVLSKTRIPEAPADLLKKYRETLLPDFAKRLVESVYPQLTIPEVFPYCYDFDYTIPPWVTVDPQKGAFQFNLDKFLLEYFYYPKGEQYELATNPGRKLENPFDLRNLRFIDPQMVTDAVEKIIAFSQSEEVEAVVEEDEEGNERKIEIPIKDKPIACMIATGGTIASRMVGGSIKAGVSADKVLRYSGWNVPENYNVVAISLPQLIDSSQMKQDYDADITIAISYISQKIAEHETARKKFIGFMASHGTDTMGDSSTRTAVMLGPNLLFSVGFVGSQTTMEEEANEIPANIHNCLLTLRAAYQEEKNFAFVAMGGTSGFSFNPAGVKKASDTDIAEGFKSEAIEPIREFGNTQRSKKPLNVPFHEQYTKHARSMREDEFLPIIVRGSDNSDIFEVNMGKEEGYWRRRVLELDEHVKAIIIRTYGAFSADKRDIDEIMAAARALKVTVFAANPFPTGLTEEHQYEASQYLIQKGAVPLQMLPHAAVAKVLINDAEFGKIDPLGEMIAGNSRIGEQPTTWTPATIDVTEVTDEETGEQLVKRKVTVVSSDELANPHVARKYYGSPQEAKPTKRLVPYP